MSGVVAGRGAACRHCGGQLRPTAHADLYECAYCDTAHLDDPGEAQAFVPSERLGRFRVLQQLGRQLRELGVDGHAVTSTQRVWLPFWQVEATLAGWQRYQPRSITATKPGSAAPLPQGAEPLEEVVARRVTASLPACDLRGWGLLGVADVVGRVRLRPMRSTLFERETVMSVSMSRRASDRRVLQRKQTTVRPAGAHVLAQHFQLMRPDRSLIYYPVWKLLFTVHGTASDAIVDGVSGRLLRGRIPRTVQSRSAAWWGATAASAWFGGLHPAFGALSILAWAVHRVGSRPLPMSPHDWGSWLSSELADAGDGVHRIIGGEEA
jgi:hypothetical protein